MTISVVISIIVSLYLVIPAAALERPADVWYGLEEQGGPWHPGMYVVGDSISNGVPYVATGTAGGAHVWVRWQAGWSTYPHRRTLWGASNLDSFTDAARSPASVVFVQLGTNDTGCMRAGNALCGGDHPVDEAARQNERLRMVLETTAAARQLIDAGKCVIWAGTREIDRAGSAQVDAADFNAWLRNMQGQFPGRFHYADYHAYSFDNAALRHSLDEAPGADRVHPVTAAGRQAIANLAVYLARALCHMP